LEKILLKVYSVLNSERAILEEDANIIYKLIYDEFKKGNCVELDFSGISYINTAFLNVAIGKFYNTEFGANFVDKHLFILGMEDEHDRNILEKVVSRAIEYFSGDSEKIRRSIEKILGEKSND